MKGPLSDRVAFAIFWLIVGVAFAAGCFVRFGCGT